MKWIKNLIFSRISAKFMASLVHNWVSASEENRHTFIILYDRGAADDDVSIGLSGNIDLLAIIIDKACRENRVVDLLYDNIRYYYNYRKKL